MNIRERGYNDLDWIQMAQGSLTARLLFSDVEYLGEFSAEQSH
jgi:hypothetical protein